MNALAVGGDELAAAVLGHVPAGAHREVEVLERGLERLDPGEADAAGGERGDEVGDAALVVELHDRGVAGHVAAHARDVLWRRRAVAGSSAARRTTALGQNRRVSSSGRAGHDVVAVLEHDDLLGQALGLHQEVGAHEDGATVGGHLADHLEHRVARLGVEARGGLVEEQQVGLVEDRAGEGEAGLHAGREATDLAVEGVLDAEAVGRGADAVGRPSRPDRGRRARPSRRGCRSRSGGRRGRAWRTPRRSGCGPPRRRRRDRGRTPAPSRCRASARR